MEMINFTDNEFNKWLTVMSLFSIYCGLSSEKIDRINYIMRWSEEE